VLKYQHKTKRIMQPCNDYLEMTPCCWRENQVDASAFPSLRRRLHGSTAGCSARVSNILK